MPTQSPNAGASIIPMLVMFGVIFGLMYILVLRPQRKKETERLKMLGNIQKNDTVLTSGGIYGVVQQVKDNEVTLKIDESNNTKIRISKSAIIGIERDKTAV